MNHQLKRFFWHGKRPADEAKRSLTGFFSSEQLLLKLQEAFSRKRRQLHCYGLCR